MKLKDCIHFLNKLFIQKIFNSIKNVYYPSHLTPVRGSFPGILGGVSLQCVRITINKTVWHWCTSCKESKECYWPILFIESTNDVIWTGWKSIVAHSTHPFSLSGFWMTVCWSLSMVLSGERLAKSSDPKTQHNDPETMTKTGLSVIHRVHHEDMASQDINCTQEGG